MSKNDREGEREGQRVRERERETRTAESCVIDQVPATAVEPYLIYKPTYQETDLPENASHTPLPTCFLLKPEEKYQKMNNVTDKC
jgi:hypothetical protein